MTEKKKAIYLTTPIGEANWFKLIHPDEKFNKYQCDLILDDSPEVQSLMEKIEELTEDKVQELKGKAKNKAAANKIKDSGNRPIQPEYDDEGEETGRFVLKMSSPTEYKTKDGKVGKMYPPKIFDAAGKEIKGEPREELKVGSGTTMRANLELRVYGNPSIGCGVSLRPKAVQIVELKEWGGASSGGGFDAVEGGFTMSEEATFDNPGDSGDF